MTHNMDDMVAIASGSRRQVGVWARVLRAAAIGFLVVTASGTPEAGSSNTELWVATDDADEARSAIRSAEGPNEKRIW
jgi:hypothetical protein